MTKWERERNPGLYSIKTVGPTTVLLTFEDGGAKSSMIRRRAQRHRKDIKIDEVSQVLRGSASDNLRAQTGCCVLDFLFCWEPVQFFKDRFRVFALRDLRMSLAAEFCTCWSCLMNVYG